MYKHSARKQKCDSETITWVSCPSRLSKIEKLHRIILVTSLSHEHIRENSFCCLRLGCCRFLVLLSNLHISLYQFWGELFLWCPFLTLWIVFLSRRDHRSYKHNASFQLLHSLQWRTCFIFQISRINMNRTEHIVWTVVPDSYVFSKCYTWKTCFEFLCLIFSYLMFHNKIKNSAGKKYLIKTL